MKQKSKNQSNNTKQITVDDVDDYELLTEEEFERATDAVQVRHLLETDFSQALERDDVRERLNVRIGGSEGLRVAIYEIPCGFCYIKENEVELEIKYNSNITDYYTKIEEEIEFWLENSNDTKEDIEADKETLTHLTL